LKLCFLFEYATLNGGEYSLLATVCELTRLAPDWKLEAWGPMHRPGGGKSFGEALAQAGITYLPLEFRTLNGEPRPRDEVEEDIVQLAQARQPGIIHANSLSAGRWLGRVVPRLACPTTAHLRDIIRLSESAVAELARHQRLFAVSEATRSHHFKQGLPPDRIVTVYNGLDLNQFSPRPRTGWLRTQLGLPAEALVIGSIGQINLRKGLDVLAKAAEQIVAQFPGVHFVHAGERFSQKPESIAFDQQLDETFARLPPPARWHRLGIVEDVTTLYPELDVLVHPARQEPFGRVLLEAAAMNVPIVATNVGGTAEMFHAGEPARLIEPDSSQQLAEAVCDVLGQPGTTRESASRMGQAIRDRFPAERCARELVREWGKVGEEWGGVA
jgi:glycosyltransferase involved in cell wall biosynthesis